MAKVKIEKDESSDMDRDETKKKEAKVAKSADKKDRKKGAKEKTLEELTRRCEVLEKEKDELDERVLRIHAEADNFKKRLTKEKEEFQKYSNEKIVKELLPVIDNLERAVDHAAEARESGSLLEGIEITLNLFRQVLEKIGVSHISAIGEPFDPEKHEAVQQIESGDYGPNIVVSEFQKGYMLHERLIRPAMVAVSKPPQK